MAGKTDFDYHRSTLNPLIDYGRRHHGHQFQQKYYNAGILPSEAVNYQPVSNDGKTQVKKNTTSSSSSTTSGEALNPIQLSKLGENREYVPPEFVPTFDHALNDRKQLELIQRTGYELTQRNGQRIYGGPPPDWRGPPPAKGTEIFVGKVPRDIYEWELVPIFEKYGVIYELRLMMDFSGTNRGYLFVRYSNNEEAKRAVKFLNNFEIRPGKKIGVIPSVDNRKLWISGLPKNRTSDEILQEMQKLTIGATNVVIYSSYNDKTQSRGYCFVEYETHRHAALARRKLVPGHNFIFDQEIQRVDWAEPENEVDANVMSKVKKLFLRNLTLDTLEDEIKEAFDVITDGQVEHVKKAKGYAFVHFKTREAAEKAFEATKDNFVLNKCPVEVTWSKPIDRESRTQKKFLTRALNSKSSKPISAFMSEQHGTQFPFQMFVNNNFLPQAMVPLNQAISSGTGTSNNHGIGKVMKVPGPEGAFGMRRTPGTGIRAQNIPPIHTSSGFNNYNMKDQEFTKMMMKNPQFVADFAALSVDSNYDGLIPPLGGPTSPPSNSAGPVFFGAGSGNLRMSAPSNMSVQSSPIYYYGSI